MVLIMDTLRWKEEEKFLEIRTLDLLIVWQVFYHRCPPHRNLRRARSNPLKRFPSKRVESSICVDVSPSLTESENRLTKICVIGV